MDDLRSLLSEVPFVEGFIYAASITARVRAAGVDPIAQLALARELCGDGHALEQISKFISQHARPVVFAEQNCMVFERLMIEAAADTAPAQRRTDANNDAMVRALLGASSISGAVADRAGQSATSAEDLLGILIQNGAYNSKRNPQGEIARARELYLNYAFRSDLVDARCPVDRWMVEDYGFHISEQFDLGFALSAVTHSWDDNPKGPFYIAPAKIDDLLLKLGIDARREDALDLVSATREQLIAEFDSVGDSLAHMAWETRPFMTRPFVRTADGGLILTTPRAMQSWLTEGFHYRLLTSAQSRSQDDDGRTSNLFSSFAGKLLEAYALDLMRSVLPGDRPPGAGRVHGEQAYGRRGQRRKTPDIAVDLGQDLILFEISNSRLRADTLLVGDRERIIGDLDRMIIKKITQLSNRIDDLLDGEAELPDVGITDVRRIWPVLVTAGEISQSDLLWNYIADKALGLLQQSTVQPLTLLDVEDFDQLCAFVENGHALHTLLKQKTQPAFRHQELAIWTRHDPNAPRETAPPQMVREAFTQTIDHLMDSADFSIGQQPAESPRSP